MARVLNAINFNRRRLENKTPFAGDTKMTKRTIEIDDTLQQCIDAACDDVRDALIDWLEEHHDVGDGEPDAPCLHNDLDYSGRVHEIIDGSVPIYTSEIDGLWYLYGHEFEAAFDDAGIGDRRDEDWPCGWKPAAIYCYIEQCVTNWYAKSASDLVADWWTKKAAAH
jgi:hypothetical protein